MSHIRAIPALIAVPLTLLTRIHKAHAAPPPELIAAVRAGDSAKVKSLLQTPGQANARDERGNTALHWAALANDAALVSHLLAAGFDPRATNSVGATPLHYGTGSDAIVRDLLWAGADANAKSLNGTSPLHTAAARPDAYRSVKRLLDAGAGADAPRAGQLKHPPTFAL